MRTIAKDQAVNFVAAADGEGGKPSVKKGKILEVRHQSTADVPGVAMIEFSEKDHAIAAYSENGEVGTFHFPEETRDVKKSDAFGASPAAPTTAAVNGSKA